jgi:Domain of unknown function (DUF4258)
MATVVPMKMSKPMALRIIRELAADSDRIVVIAHARQRQKQRCITRRQVELCLRNGFIQEGPFMNHKGHWQVTMNSYSAGEQLACVVAIDWPNRLIVITTY